MDAVEKEPELLGGRIKDASHNPPIMALPAGHANRRVRQALPAAAGLVLGWVDQLVHHALLRGRGGGAQLHGGDLLDLPISRSHLLILPAAHLHRLEQLTSQGYRAIAAIEPDDRAATSGAFHVVFPATNLTRCRAPCKWPLAVFTPYAPAAISTVAGVYLFDFTEGPHLISTKGSTEIGGAKRRSDLPIYIKPPWFFKPDLFSVSFSL